MKKKISRIWGIGFVIVLAASLLLSAAPVSAGTLSWGSEDLPDEFVDTAGDDIIDMAISGDGSVIYVSVSSNLTYRSSNGGQSWTTATVIDGTDVLNNVDLIAVAQDDPNYIAVCNTTVTGDIYVFISDDAGANWDTLGTVGDLTTGTDLAISVEKGGNHYIAVIGDDGTNVETWYYEIGAIGSVWTLTTGGSPATATDAGAVAFSPNFYSDQVMVNITMDTAGDTVDLNIYSFNTNTWNSGAFTAYPASLEQDTPTGDILTLDAAAIAMAPDYLGSDDDMRVLFYTLTINAGTDTETDGLFRLDDDTVTTLKDEKEMYSVAFDGSLLVAGRYDNSGVYRSTDPLADDPSVSGSTSTKNPGSSSATPLVLVGIAGSTVVAGTSGDESAFAYSEDNGATFNDLSLIDTVLTTLSDVAVTPDGSKTYLVTANSTGNGLSVWRLTTRWERIYSNDDADSDYIIRIAPDDSDVIYLADASGTSVYFSSSGGAEKWHTRIYKETTGIVDLAVETDGDTVYILTTLGYVSKSSNRGFTWDSKKSSKLTGGSSMIASLGEDLLVAGSSNGRVAYSTDGNSSWTKLSDEDFDETDLVQVTATGLADGDFIIAASNDEIYSWELGEASDWDDISPEGRYTGNVTYGIGIWEGVLYALADNTTDSILARTLTPTSDSPTWSLVESAGETFGVGPTALRASVSGDVTKLWAIDNDASMALFSYKDSLATVSVTSRAPADGADIPFNTVSGEAEQIVFSWVCPSDSVADYDFEIATDTDFDEIVISESVAKSSGTWDSGDIISKIVGPGASGDFDIRFMPDTTYYWKTRVDAAGPVRSAWSETRSFTTGSLPEILPPVVIEQPPAPIIQVPPAPAITITPPEIVLPAPPPAPPEIVIPSAPAPTPPVPQWALMVIIIIGAVLVIALIVLIMRTRRPV